MSLRRLACVDVPDLPLQMLLRDNPAYRDAPVAVVAEERPEAELLLLNRHARALRLSTGMRYGAAKSLVPELRVGVVSAVEVEQLAGALVRDLQTFSPHVERDPVHAGVFYIDPTGLAHLYGGEESWARCLSRYLTARQFSASVVVAFGRSISYALVRNTRGVRVIEHEEEALRLAREVSFERLAMQPKLRVALERLGLSTLGDLAHFGADQLGLRFGGEASRWCAVARGHEVLPLCPEPHVDTPRSELEIEPPDSDVARLCFAIKQALDTLLESVRQRGASIRALWMRLILERGGESVQRLEPSSSTRNGPLLLELLRLRLNALTLTDAVARVVLEAELSDLAPGQLAMFAPRRDVAAGDRALARLKASYGPDVVCRAVLEDAHLPEAKYRWSELSHIALPVRAAQVEGRGASAHERRVEGRGASARERRVEGRASSARERRDHSALARGGSARFDDELEQAPLPLVRRVLLKPEPLAGSFEVDPGTGALSLVHAGERMALTGPYRVSGGWWVREVARDYYYARTTRTPMDPSRARRLRARASCTSARRGRTLGSCTSTRRLRALRPSALDLFRRATQRLVPTRSGRLMKEYVPLWVKSNHSFLEGASHPEQLVERAHALGLDTLAITDRDGVYGAVKAHVKAKELGLKLIIGAQVTLTPDLESEPAEQLVQEVVLLAKTRAGYGALCRLLSLGRARKEKGKSLVSLDEVRAAAGELIALCSEPTLLASLKSAFGADLYALCARHLAAEERAREQLLRARAEQLSIPLVASTEVLYHAASCRPLQDVLTCIRLGITLRSAGTRIKQNAEHELKSHAIMEARFADDLTPLHNTRRIAEQCHFSYDQLHYRYPGEALPAGRSESEHLRVLSYEGAARRYPAGIADDVRAQLDAELSLIAELEYGGYFLTMYELVQFCVSNGILCQGRGSAANSVVCFCLGITAIDPVQMDLLFERFLSRERKEPPDIDLDIEHARREEVIQWMYQRYGRRHAAMVANLIRYRARSAVRDVGKVLGIPATELDGVARLLGHFADGFDESTLREAGLDPQSGAFVQLLKLCGEIKDFPRHLSIHPGGFLLGHEPVDSIVPIEPATMEGRTVIQWDKYDVESLGLFKVDLLGLGALTAIRHSFALLDKHKDLRMGMADIPHDEPETYAMIARGDTVGVFQIESRAQMSMLPRIKPNKFYDLVIEVAIVRPGPIQGDMVHPYLRRRERKEPVVYPHPSFKRVLEKTLGVPIFQEQVMKLAILAADYSPGEADLLRRDMAAWRSAGRIEEHHDRLVSRMVARGVPEEFAERMFSQIRGFGEYGFPESHAASFALLAYVTSWLRCHHPEVFLCAMLNAQPMGFYAPATLIEDGARQGVITLPIDVNHSQWDCTLEPCEVPRARASKDAPERSRVGASITKTLAVRMGYRYVKGLGTREQERLEFVPRPVRSIEDFARQSQLAQRGLVSLAEAGAFDSLGMTRREALWRVRGASPSARDSMRSEPGGETPALCSLSVAEQVLWDYQVTEHSARGHPVEPLRAWLSQRGVIDASALRATPHGRKVDCVGLVICRQRPGTATGVVFLTLEDEHGFMNVVVWNNVFDRYQRVVRTARMLGVRGTVQSIEGVVHLVAESIYVPEIDLAGLSHKSRDFH